MASSPLNCASKTGPEVMKSTNSPKKGRPRCPPEFPLARGHRGKMDTATSRRAVLAGSQIRDSHLEGDERVQDPYCIRCQPQVDGACLDMLRSVAATLEIEANAVTDNPLIFPETGEIISGGNFHAEPVAFAADMLALALCEIGSLAERRVAIALEPSAREWLAKKGYDPIYGARPLARVVQREVRDCLTDEILFGALENGGTVEIGVNDDALTFTFAPEISSNS